MKKNRLMSLAAVLLVLTLVTACFVGGTFAKYTSSKEVTSGAGTVASWSFNVNDKDIATEDFAIVIFDDINETNVDGSLLAPGTTGSFDIKLENTSDVTAEYTVALSANEDSVPLKWRVQGDAEWKEDLSALNYDGTLAHGDAATTKTIEWQWVIGDASDADTALGKAAAAGNSAQPTVTVSVTATQVD